MVWVLPWVLVEDFPRVRVVRMDLCSRAGCSLALEEQVVLLGWLIANTSLTFVLGACVESKEDSAL